MTTLDDASAIHILKVIAQARLGADVPDDLRAALETARPASEGDLARAALDVLAEDPAFAEPIETMSRHPVPAQRYLDPATIAVTVAALLVLQTRGKIKRGTDGKWSFEMEKRASGDGPVKLLLERLLAHLN
jgi:hypothetical protein